MSRILRHAVVVLVGLLVVGCAGVARPARSTPVPIRTPSHTPLPVASSARCIPAGEALTRAVSALVADGGAPGRLFAVEYPGPPRRGWFVAARVGPGEAGVAVWGTTVDPTSTDGGGITVAVNEAARHIHPTPGLRPSPLFPAEALEVRAATACVPEH